MADLTAQERARVIDTLIAEGATGGYDAMLAIANVVANRAAERGLSPYGVVSEPGQFDGFSNPGSKSKAAMKDEGLRAIAASALDAALTGDTPDPTNGATYFHSGQAPYWADGLTRTSRVGGLSFYSDGSAPRATAVASQGAGREADDRIALAPAPRPDLASRTLVAYSRNPPVYEIEPGANIEGVDARLQDTVRAAAEAFMTANPGYRVVATSGKEGRLTGTRNHIAGNAIDVRIYDPKGNLLPNSPARASAMGMPLGPAFRAYEQYAQAARQYQLQTYPEMGTLRWGGYFRQGTQFDLMHLDITDRPTKLGDWSGGLNEQGRRMLADAQSVGMGEAATQYAANWSPFGEFSQTAREPIVTPSELSAYTPGDAFSAGRLATPGAPVPALPQQAGPNGTFDDRAPSSFGAVGSPWPRLDASLMPASGLARAPTSPATMTGTQRNFGKLADDMGWPTIAESDRMMEVFRETGRGRALGALPARPTVATVDTRLPRSKAAIEGEIAALKADIARTASGYLERGINTGEAVTALEHIGVLQPASASPSISDRTRAAGVQPRVVPDLKAAGGFTPQIAAAAAMRDEFPRDAIYDRAPLNASATSGGNVTASARERLMPALPVSIDVGAARALPSTGASESASANRAINLLPRALPLDGASYVGGPSSAAATARTDPVRARIDEGFSAAGPGTLPSAQIIDAARNVAPNVSLGPVSAKARLQPALSASATGRIDLPLRVPAVTASGSQPAAQHASAEGRLPVAPISVEEAVARGALSPGSHTSVTVSRPVALQPASVSLTGSMQRESTPAARGNIALMTPTVMGEGKRKDDLIALRPVSPALASPFPPGSEMPASLRERMEAGQSPTVKLQPAMPRVTALDDARELQAQNGRLDRNLTPVFVPKPVATTPIRIASATPYPNVGPAPGKLTRPLSRPPQETSQTAISVSPKISMAPPAPSLAAPPAPTLEDGGYQFRAPTDKPGAMRRAVVDAVKAGLSRIITAGPIERAREFGMAGGTFSPGAFWHAYNAAPGSPALQNQAAYVASKLMRPLPAYPVVVVRPGGIGSDYAASRGGGFTPASYAAAITPGSNSYNRGTALTNSTGNAR